MSSKDYYLISLIFAVLILCLLLASRFLDLEYTATCQILKVTGKECSSCGLTRDFISFSHFDFASPHNSQSIYVYIWVFFQLVLRLTVVALPSQKRLKFIFVDSALSFLSALYVFLPFWI